MLMGTANSPLYNLIKSKNENVYGNMVFIVRREVQSPTWKNTVPPKEPIPTWSEIT